MARDNSLPFDKEKDFTAAAIKWLNSQEKTWFVKYHASGYSANGVPDLLGHINGKFVAFELKAKDEKATPLQQLTIDKIYDSGAIAILAHTMYDIQCIWKGITQEAVT